MPLSFRLLLLALELPGAAAARAAAAPPVVPADSVVHVAAGPQYQRSWLHQLLWGFHYRQVWAAPVTAPVLNLRTVVPGGLKPIKEGGSFQTRNLRLVGADGRQYVLRSVDKDATAALPEELRNGAIGRLMKDQTSVIHPYGAYIVPRLAQAAGVYHTNPRLYFLPDDPALGEFRQAFAGALYLLEERPEGDQRAVRSFGGSALVVSSRHAFSQLLASARTRVDARHYLRSRLFDMWLGDWSRREDQWRWAAFAGADSSTVLRAIPRDRDHAFFKFDDGALTRLVSFIKTNYQTFGRDIKLHNVEGLNRAARPMDKSLLVYLSERDFREVADSLRQALTNPVIAEALRVWPREVYALSGAEFQEKLQTRREQLPRVAEEFYRQLARDVEIPGTDEPERFVVEAAGNWQAWVRVYALRPDGRNGRLIGQRLFDARQTASISLFGLGGNDEFELIGLPDRRLRVHIYDGQGQDLVQQLQVPPRATGTRVAVHDSGDGNTLQVEKKLVDVELYQPKANEYNGAGWLLRHRLY